jgi:ankyrin repeat protein
VAHCVLLVLLSWLHQTALHTACRANLVGAITLLVSHPSVNVNAVEGHTGMTPLMLALRNAQPKLAVRSGRCSTAWLAS